MSHPSSGHHGLLLVDKPTGITSHDVIDVLRRVSGQRRIGHGGTLDPLATGLLPVVFGSATRLIRFLPGDPKQYEVTALLGLETDTGDADGKAQGLPAPGADSIDPDRIDRALRALEGPQQQLPPMYSAKQVQGQRLYRAARAGVEVDRSPVPIRVDSMQLVARNGPELRLLIDCSPGTYVRTLVSDLGRALGVGAHVTGLRRRRSGPLQVADALPLVELTSERIARALRPPASFPLAMPTVAVDAAQASAFRAGRALACPESSDAGPWMSVRLSDGTLLGVAEMIIRATRRELQPRVVME